MMTLSLTMFGGRAATISAVSFRAFTVANVTSYLNGWRWTFDAWHLMTQQRNAALVAIAGSDFSPSLRW